MNKELKITMLGASGVGKTTLLTSMYEQFEATTREADIQLVPDEETKAILQDYLEKLKSMTEEFMADERNKGIPGTAATADPNLLPKYSFDLGKRGQKSLRLLFRDYPGGYVSSKDPAERKFVQNLLTECAAVIIAIDTPAMMELKGKWHALRNKPDEITKLFKTAYGKLEEPKLVIFAPVKCETYVQDEESANKLEERIQKEYAPLLEYFQAPGLRDKVAVVVTPVQTVGCVVFLRIEVENMNRPRFWFAKTSYDAQYSPKDSEQMLRYLLRFLFKRHNQGLLIERSPILRSVRQIFSHNTEFERAVEQFAKDCKTTSGFAVLQGQKWLNI